jgi:hypothetical protein
VPIDLDVEPLDAGVVEIVPLALRGRSTAASTRSASRPSCRRRTVPLSCYSRQVMST